MIHLTPVEPARIRNHAFRSSSSISSSTLWRSMALSKRLCCSSADGRFAGPRQGRHWPGRFHRARTGTRTHRHPIHAEPAGRSDRQLDRHRQTLRRRRGIGAVAQAPRRNRTDRLGPHRTARPLRPYAHRHLHPTAAWSLRPRLDRARRMPSRYSTLMSPLPCGMREPTRWPPSPIGHRHTATLPFLVILWTSVAFGTRCLQGLLRWMAGRI